MAFQNKNLSVIAYANGFTLWHYVTPDTKATVVASGYFNDIKTLLNVGDIIHVNASDGTMSRAIAATTTNVTVGTLG